MKKTYNQFGKCFFTYPSFKFEFSCLILICKILLKNGSTSDEFIEFINTIISNISITVEPENDWLC